MASVDNFIQNCQLIYNMESLLTTGTTVHIFLLILTVLQMIQKQQQIKRKCSGGDAQRVREVHVRLSYRLFTDTMGSAQKHHLVSSQHLSVTGC